MNKRVLILCTGNSCRSQMAEGFLRSFDNSLDVFSAGTSPEKSINPNAVIVMSEAGVDISSQLPEDVNKFINESFDFIITLCDNARKICPPFTGKIRQSIHISISDPANVVGSDEQILDEYRKVRDGIKKNLTEFIKDLN